MQDSFPESIIGSRFIGILLKCGSSTGLDPEERRKRIAAVFSLLTVIIAAFSSAVVHLYHGDYGIFALDSLGLFIVLLTLFYLRKQEKGIFVYRIICLGFVILYGATTVCGRSEISMLLWVFLFPPIVFSILGHKNGLWLSAAFFFLNLFLMSASGTILPSEPFSLQVIVRSSIIYAILTFVIYYFEFSQKMLINYIRQEKNKFENASKRDLLTGLSNRRDMIDRLENERERHLRLEKTFTLILGDIDNFKALNDKLGHDAGDYVLKTIGHILKNQVRGIDCPSRWGGEEFLIMLVDTELDGGQRVAERIRKKIENTNFQYKDEKISVTMTFGLSIYQAADDNIDECIKRSDRALYEGKNQGRNKVVAAD